MPINADRWMLDYPGLEPSNGQLRTDIDQLEVETHHRVQMAVDGVRSVLPSVPNWGNQPTYNRVSMEVHAIAGRVQQFGGSPGLYDYIKAVLADQVYPVVRPIYNKATHVGLDEFIKRLGFYSSDRSHVHALQFTKVENGIAVRWFDKTIVLPFVELTDAKLSLGASHENGIGAASTEDGLYFPVDGRLYLSAKKFIAQATLAIERPWITGITPCWDLFNADDPEVIQRLGDLLAHQIDLVSDHKYGDDFAKFFVEWYNELPLYETNLTTLAKELEFLQMAEFDDLPKVLEQIESVGGLWRFAEQSYGNFFYPGEADYDIHDPDGVRKQFLEDFQNNVVTSDSNSNVFHETKRLEIFELVPVVDYTNKALKYYVRLHLREIRPRQMLEQLQWNKIDSLLVKQINNRLTAFLDNYRTVDEPEV